MRKLFFMLFALVGLALLAPAPVFAADDEDTDDRSSKPVSRGAEAALSRAFAQEIKALTEAESMLKTISDAKSAKEVKKKLMQKFSLLRPLLNGSNAQLEELAVAQNRVSAIMWEMMKQPYFETENMQELWTVMTHHFARRSANAK